MLKYQKYITGIRKTNIKLYLSDDITIMDNVVMIRKNGRWFGRSGIEPSKFNTWNEFKNNEISIIGSAQEVFNV